MNLGTAGTGCNATFDYEKSGATASGWAADGYVFTDGGKFAKIGGLSNLGDTITVQIVCDVGKGTSQYPTLFGSTNDFCNIYAFTAGTRLFFKVWNQGGRPELSPQNSWEGQFANGGWLDGKCAVYQSATPDPSIWVGKWRDVNYGALNGAALYIGGVYNTGDSSFVDARRLAGKVQAVRVYKRSLTDEELAHNRMVDEARFRGNPPESNVVVVNDGGECEPAVGAYKVDGAWTFTATTAPDENGVPLPVRGYTVETWNGSDWVRSGGGTGGSYTYGDDNGKVRLTWKWKANGLFVMFL